MDSTKTSLEKILYYFIPKDYPFVEEIVISGGEFGDYSVGVHIRHSKFLKRN